MNTVVSILQFKEMERDTDLIVRVPLRLGDIFRTKGIRKAEIRFDDGRHISTDQRKKIYATIRDIADYTGYLPEEMKEIMKYRHIERTGEEYFSLSDCSMDLAREFLNTILEFALEWGIQLSENPLDRTDDINRYLYFCIIHRKCAVCGKDGEIHHEDAIGMGNDRRTIDDSNHKKICLCRLHHTIAHQKGVLQFRKDYKIYGIIIPDKFPETEERQQF